MDSSITDLPKHFGCASRELLEALSPSVLLGGLRSAIANFKEALGHARVIVVNVGSTEKMSPLAGRLASCTKWEELDGLIQKADGQLPWGVLYACAALLEDCAYVNFTPNIGSELPALIDLAIRRRLPHAGKDGKTGETLLKAALAPMFEARALRVRAWTGYNILGNSDGQSLEDPAACHSKINSKDQQLRGILHDAPDLCTKVGIDYVPSLGDWKTAWDFVHFEGILGIKMSLHLLWQGADTVLAAPVLLDLIRLTELAWRQGEAGVLRHLDAFFKSPTQCTNHDFWFQMAELRRHLGI
jgi:myo-inositol-1-phosphate synthase